MCVLYLLGACILYFKREGFLETSFYIGFFTVIFSSILCLYAFYSKVFSRLKVSPFALVLTILMAQYLTIFALSASGIIWNTNKELKALANSVNRECRSGTYLYGLSTKDETILRFYVDDSYVLESLSGLSASPRRCLVSEGSAKQQISKDLYNDKILKSYFR